MIVNFRVFTNIVWITAKSPRKSNTVDTRSFRQSGLYFGGPYSPSNLQIQSLRASGITVIVLWTNYFTRVIGCENDPYFNPSHLMHCCIKWGDFDGNTFGIWAINLGAVHKLRTQLRGMRCRTKCVCLRTGEGGGGYSTIEYVRKYYFYLLFVVIFLKF